MKAAGPRLAFDWPQRERFPLLLFGCVFLSLFAHVATFFLFQVIYPQRVTIPPPAPQVELLTASSPENEALLRWIDAEDPALVASAHSVLPARLFDLDYRPSFATVRTVPRGSVESPVVVSFPPARHPLSIIQSVTPRAEPPARAAVATPSDLSLSGPLRERGLATPFSFHFEQRVADPAEPLRALLGVNTHGEVRYVFLQQSSGQAELDQAALAHLRALNFSRNDQPVTWGFATVTFGAEAYGENLPLPETPAP